MEENKINALMDMTVSKIRQLVDADTIIGKPISTPDGITVIPVSRMSFGIGTGGTTGSKGISFTGGNGAGVSVVPLGFLVIDGTDVRLLDLKHPEAYASRPQDPVNKTIDAINGIVDRAPELVIKIKDLFSKDRTAEETAEPVVAPAED